MADVVNIPPTIEPELRQLREDIHNWSGTYPDYEVTRANQREWVKRLDWILDRLPKD